jgi:hypothetical protein
MTLVPVAHVQRPEVTSPLHSEALEVPHCCYATRAPTHWQTRMQDCDFFCAARQIPELELHLTPMLRLEACSANLGHLAKLTNLTALHVAFADCSPDTRLGHLRTLSQLRRLCISTAGFGEVQQRSNEACIFGQELRGLCRAMQQLTCLKLALRPAWFDSIRSLQHLRALPALQELVLCRPPDAYPGKDVEAVALIPASYIPTSVVRLELEGYAVLPEPKAAAAAPAAC